MKPQLIDPSIIQKMESKGIKKIVKLLVISGLSLNLLVAVELSLLSGKAEVTLVRKLNA